MSYKDLKIMEVYGKISAWKKNTFKEVLMNNVSMIGRLTSKPELRFLPDGTAITRFNLAIDRRISKSKKEEYIEQGKPTADFPKVVVFGKQAEYCCNYLDKGRLIGVAGSVITGSYEKTTGEKVYTTEIKASEIKSLQYKDSTSTDIKEEFEGEFEDVDEDIPF